MKILFLQLVVVITFFSMNCWAQVKKPIGKPSTIAKPQSSDKAKEGSLKLEDYDYYIQVKRGLEFDEPAAKPYYSLSSNGNYLGGTTDYSGSWVILDIRTGKEVSWWPGGKTYYSPKNQQLYIKNEKMILAFSQTGMSIYQNVFIMPNNSPYKGVRYLLSNDWQKAVIPFNNDIVIGDFDLKTGIINDTRQTTFTGVFGYFEAYMVKDYLVTFGSTGLDSYIINLKTGKYTACGDWRHSNMQFTDIFYALYDDGYWVLKDQSFIPFNQNFFHVHWVDENQTKYVYAKRQTGGKMELFYTDGKTSTKLNWPFLTDEASSSPRSFYLRLNPIYRRYVVSPNSSRFIRNSNGYLANGKISVSGQGDSQLYLTIYDAVENWEKTISISRVGTMGGPVGIAWADDDHFFFNAKSDQTIIDGVPIKTSTQGTYVYDIKTNKSTKISAYFIDERGSSEGRNGPLILTWHPGANYVVFEANNFLFRCRPDGTELEPITKFPRLYYLQSNFLDQNLNLE